MPTPVSNLPFMAFVRRAGRSDEVTEVHSALFSRQMLMLMEDGDAIAMNEQGCRDAYLRLHVPRLQAMCVYVSVCVGCFKLLASSENQ